MYRVNIKQSIAEVSILMSDTVDIRTKKTARGRRGHDTKMKYNEDNTILNVYVPNDRAAKRVKHKLIGMKGERDKPTITVGNVGSSLPAIDGKQIKRKSARIKEFNTTTEQQNLINIYRTPHPQQQNTPQGSKLQDSPCPGPWGGQRALNKLKRIKMIHCVL